MTRDERQRYPHFCSVWLLFRTKETSFVYQDMRGFLFV